MSPHPQFFKKFCSDLLLFSFLGKQFLYAGNFSSFYQTGRSKNSPWNVKPGDICSKAILCDKRDIWFLVACFLDIIIKSLFRKANLIQFCRSITGENMAIPFIHDYISQFLKGSTWKVITITAVQHDCVFRWAFLLKLTSHPFHTESHGVMMCHAPHSIDTEG